MEGKVTDISIAARYTNTFQSRFRLLPTSTYRLLESTSLGDYGGRVPCYKPAVGWVVQRGGGRGRGEGVREGTGDSAGGGEEDECGEWEGDEGYDLAGAWERGGDAFAG